MLIIEKITEMQAKAEELSLVGKKIGFVPTMGYLHEGHLSLIRIAREKSDIVITSIFVNPTQFGPGEDYEAYPRDFQRDTRLAEEVGSNIIFHPSVDEMYPQGYQTHIKVEKITKVLCGISRPTHFQGVTTVVAKLFNATKPQLAVFGQKDAQQAFVIKRMVKDLNMDIEILVAPIVREPDGLAMSSRNSYLTPTQRKEAVVLYRSLMKAKAMIEEGHRDSQHIIQEITHMINHSQSAKIDYVSIVDSQDLQPVATLEGEILIAEAVCFGKTRLIDNIIVQI